MLRGAQHDTAVVLQLIIEGDEEVEHGVAHLVRLIEDQERLIEALEPTHHSADLLRYAQPAGIQAHSLHHCRQPAPSILILGASNAVDLLVRGHILAYRRALATAGTPDDSHHLAITLGAVEQLSQLFIDIRMDDGPALGREPDLLADVVPHPLGDGLPIAI